MSHIPQLLQAFKFDELFNQLGWDRLTIGLEKEVSGYVYSLHPVAQKRGIQILLCLPDSDGTIPPYAIRQKIERKVTADAREHLIIFTDAAQTSQIWQWVSRASGRPTQYREVKWQQGQPTELLEQKLKAIAFALDEEESLTFFGVAERLSGGFNRDTVTKKFYKAFQTQRDAFQKFIDGIPSDDHQRWYTAVVVDRLMFLWFLQEKFFLNGDKRYLRNRLEDHLKANAGTSFYKGFLSPLFFRGFAEERTEANRAAIEREFGKVPYLNGGLFAEHELEREYGDAIDIPDTAFSSLFAFFDEWDWHLDERPLASGKEINPDVLGYIFEKFVNQKQMGAYYTKEDITEYIAKNTVIPCLFEKVRADHAAAFDAHAWQLLQEDPRRYLYPAMLHGLPLDADPLSLGERVRVREGVDLYPPEIAAGLDTQAPNLLKRRKPWNKTAAPSHGLPTEIWRETIARHNRTREILAKLAAGEVRSVADLITYNLNIRQFAQDVIERCTDPALLRAFWVALAGRMPRKSNEKFRHGISVLDPTCGSGAFLFAALQILKPLYQACLTAMSGLLADEAIAGRALGEKWKDIEEIVERFNAAALDRQRDYAITKHIIVHNLYGVDIETQATEIAKLRLFLKLVALLEPGDDIEPLPDIDFNIRAGNTLVGYASADETERAVKGVVKGTDGKKVVIQDNLFFDAWEDIRIRLTAVEQAYNNFQIQQVQRGGHVTAEDKKHLGDQLHDLEETLNYHLCREYGKDPNSGKQYDAWKASHKPFHWYVDFYPIMAAGGFDVVIGNPPYLEYSKIRSDYKIAASKIHVEAGNLYAFVTERSLHLSNAKSVVGMIVPVSIVSTQRMASLQASLVEKATVWLSNYGERPAKLFSGAEVLLTIVLVSRFGQALHSYSTGLRKWSSEQREQLFDATVYQSIKEPIRNFILPKMASPIETELLSKVWSIKKRLSHSFTKLGANELFYRIGGGRYWKVFTTDSPKFVLNGFAAKSSRESSLYFESQRQRDLACAVLSSSLFFWHFSITTNGRDLNPIDLQDFPVDLNALNASDGAKLATLSLELMREYESNSSIKLKESKQTGKVEYQEFYPRKSKDLLDKIDQCLASYYGFTDEQLDYIINYDIKYRMGLNGAKVDEDD